MIDDSTAAERFNRTPRPLNFIRVRLHRGGQVEYIRELLADERDALYEDLGKARDQGKTEDSPEITEIRDNLQHLIRAIRDIDSGRIEMAGTGEGDG